jgi:hypothetical protein
VFRIAFVMLAASIASLSFAQVYKYAPPCDRACLTGYMDAYLKAQEAHSAANLPLPKSARLTENGVTLKAGEGFFRTAGAPTYRLDIADPEMGGIASQLVVREGAEKVFEFVRLKVENKQIVEVETIIGRKGESGPMFVPDFATKPRPEFTLSIREAERGSRLELMAVADAYWRALETNGRPNYHPAPLLPGIIRIENGLATTSGSGSHGGTTGGPQGILASSAPEQFNAGMFANRTIYDRRFPVVDVERGVILSIARMGIDGDGPLPEHWKGGRPILAEFFAIQSGIIVAVDVVMNSTVPLNQSSGWPRDPLTRSKSDVE